MYAYPHPLQHSSHPLPTSTPPLPPTLPACIILTPPPSSFNSLYLYLQSPSPKLPTVILLLLNPSIIGSTYFFASAALASEIRILI